MSNAQAMSAPTSGGMSNLLLGLGVVGLVVGLFGASALFGEGHSSFNTDSGGVFWGLPVSTYVFFVLTSTGLTFVASMAMVFGLKDFYPIAKRCIWLALATLVAGFVALGLEIGNPLRMIWAMPTGMQTDSPMFWMGLWYTLYMVFLLIKFALVQKGDWDSGFSKSIGIASFVSVVIAHGTLGMVFGMMAMRPFWYGGMVPVYFLITAALSGLAFAVLFINLAHGMNQNSMSEGVRKVMTRYMPGIFALALGVVILFTFARTITGLWTNQAEVSLVMSELTSSALFQFELWVGMVLPFVLLLTGMRSQAGVQVLAAALVIIALFIGRYEYVVGGQMVPLFKGAWYPDLVSYSPSASEIGIVVLASGLCLLVYALGDKLFNLSNSPN